jgi:hypothetical protein
MKKSEHFRWTRRDFLSVAPAVLAGSLLAERAGAEERPAVTNPRATAGDAVEPKWDSRLTITVGPQKADLVGADEKAIQAGVDYIAAEGGGCLEPTGYVTPFPCGQGCVFWGAARTRCW